MFRNYLAAALRNMVRNRLYAAINIIGLAVGLAVSLLIALFVNDELSYETWVPGHERTYRVVSKLTISTGGGRVTQENGLPAEGAAYMRLDVAGMEIIARAVRDQHGIRHGDVEGDEGVNWVDPEFFRAMPLPVVAGDLAAALQSPGSMVITRRAARKYFGQDAPLGEVLELDRQHTLQVAAVIEDLPSNTSLGGDAILSTKESFSPLAALDARPIGQFTGLDWTAAYVRLSAGAKATDVEAMMRESASRRYPKEVAGIAFKIEPRLVPIAEMRFEPMLGSSSRDVVKAVSAVGVLITLVAAINFVNLMTARSTRRAVEVGVRKVAGAHRDNLVVQFVGESFMYVLVGGVGAIGVAALLLPQLNGLLGRTITFAVFHDPLVVIGALAIVVVTGIAAGGYPAFILSAFPPVAALGTKRGGGASRLRGGLVVFQFAVLIGLVLVTTVIYRQTNFAMNQGLRLESDQLLLIRTGCSEAFKEAVAAVPGVHGAVCSSNSIVGDTSGTLAVMPDGRKVDFGRAASDYGLLELYDFKPLAGRFFSRDHAEDAPATTWSNTQGSVVINQTLMRTLGYKTAAEAVGQALPWINPSPEFPKLEPRTSIIIGVAPDFMTFPATMRIEPTVFFIAPWSYQFLNVKIASDHIPDSLAAIERVWQQLGDPRPMRRLFLNEYTERLYRGFMRQGGLLAAFSAAAIFIAMLGLLGLSAFAAESRTKEIGIRKAMGADPGDILRLMIWHFAKPVLLANLIAWPAGYLVARRWLDGFVYRIELEPWTFIAASALALVIAVITVAGHTILVARAEPVTALRYE